MESYRSKEWRAYRSDMIKLHDGQCDKCERSPESHDVKLHVHHPNYIVGKKPWEYTFEECEVLCAGCHAREHNIIRPSDGWILVGEDDLGDLSGECDLCKKKLRYNHLIVHPSWHALEVGHQCCDKLTGNSIASESHIQRLNCIERRKTFVESPNWLEFDGILRIRRGSILIEIVAKANGKFQLRIGSVKGTKEHGSLLDAKIAAFDFVDSGEAKDFLEKRKK